MQSSVAFPEIVLPLLVMLKKSLKKSNGGKPVALVKTLVERIEEGVRWVGTRRETVTFAPGMSEEVERWEKNVKIEETPLGKWMRVQRKSREKKQALVDKVRTPKVLEVKVVNMFQSFSPEREKARSLTRNRPTRLQHSLMSS